LSIASQNDAVLVSAVTGQYAKSWCLFQVEICQLLVNKNQQANAILIHVSKKNQITMTADAGLLDHCMKFLRSCTALTWVIKF
jgi:hypothetical protein